MVVSGRCFYGMRRYHRLRVRSKRLASVVLIAAAVAALALFGVPILYGFLTKAGLLGR